MTTQTLGTAKPFIHLTDTELSGLRKALLENAGSRNVALRMNSRTTQFEADAPFGDELTDDEVVNAVRSVPTHYA